MLHVARKKAFCRVLGPGTRSVIWFHGCSKRCPGCIAASMHESPEYELWSPEKLAEWILQNRGIEGITLSGGEPFEQPINLLEKFLGIVKENSNLSVLSYTGHDYEQLVKNEKYQAVLRHIDVLIDGEYRIDQDTGTRWRGSDNQRFHFLTPRYAAENDKWHAAMEREIEIELDLDGSLLLSGVPPRGFIDDLSTRLNKRDIFIDFS